MCRASLLRVERFPIRFGFDMDRRGQLTMPRAVDRDARQFLLQPSNSPKLSVADGGQRGRSRIFLHTPVYKPVGEGGVLEGTSVSWARIPLVKT